MALKDIETPTLVGTKLSELPPDKQQVFSEQTGTSQSAGANYYYYSPAENTYYKGVLVSATGWEYYLATQNEINKILADPTALKLINKMKGKDENVEDKEDLSHNESPYLKNAADTGSITIAPRGKGTTEGVGKGLSSLRYPNSDNLDKGSDYVLFEFGKYNPPFLNAGKTKGVPSTGKDQVTKSVSNRYTEYHKSATDFFPLHLEGPERGGKKRAPNAGYRPIMLYMPQDVGTEYKSSWQGKAFSNAGRSVVAGANGDLNKLKDYNVTDGIRQTFASLFTAGINAVPGVAANLSLNDVTGSTRGVIMNPNVEVLFDQPDLREFGLKFKMTPHDQEEAEVIRAICRTFQRASLPGFGDVNSAEWLGDKGRTQKKGKASVGSGNFITVPHMCRVSFMKGTTLHPYLTQYKTCVITRVSVNYTPDGSYATYTDGAPVATELSLEFLESKLVFRDDIVNDGPSL